MKITLYTANISRDTLVYIVKIAKEKSVFITINPILIQEHTDSKLYRNPQGNVQVKIMFSRKQNQDSKT
jgi:hypothetical protein